MLSDMTKWDGDLQVSTMDEAIRILRANGWDCRLFAQPHAWDSIMVRFGDMEYHFTPWFFEAKGFNFAVGRWDADEDDYTAHSHLRAAFDDGQGLAKVIEDWMKDGTFDNQAS
jgi:hypothetical protein